MSELDGLIEAFTEETREYVKEVTDPIFAQCKRIDRLEQAISEFKSAVEELRAVAPVPGPKGDPGQKGIDGANGADGKDGAHGKDGVDGRDGKDGVNGKDADENAIVGRVLALLPEPKSGIDGKDGAPGIDGKDADEDAIVDRVLAAIPRPNDGVDGRNGIDGKDGLNGKDFDPECMNAAIAKAMEEMPKPADGRDGRDGLEGPPGQDAIDVEYVDLENNLARSYVRGTHAKYRGGIVRATRTTDPITADLSSAGWEVIVDGFPTFDVEHDGKREFTLLVSRTDGRVERCSFRVPVTIDCGVFKTGNRYEKGDGTTWGGSYWIAQRETNEQPGISDAWRLAVKKGRDAK